MNGMANFAVNVRYCMPTVNGRARQVNYLPRHYLEMQLLL